MVKSPVVVAGRDEEKSSGFLCPKCGAGTLCKDSRPVAKGACIRRRRQCLNRTECGYRFTTHEAASEVRFTAVGLDEMVRALVKSIDDGDAALVQARAKLGTIQNLLDLLSGA